MIPRPRVPNPVAHFGRCRSRRGILRVSTRHWIMAKDKLSTQEILALARKQDAGGAAPATPKADSPAPAADPEPAPAAEAPAEPKPAAKPAGAPKSTADILAAARAQAAGGAAPAPKPAAAGAPKSTADILAAARAQKAGGAGTAAPAATGEKKPAAAKAKAAAAAAGDRPPVEEMLKALHEGKPAGAVAVKPKLPGKPPLPARRAEPVVTRRSFPVEAAMVAAAIIMTPFAAGMALLAIISGLWGLLAARFMMPNMVVELPSKFKVGPSSDFPIGTVSEKYKASRGVWLVHSTAYNGENIVYALASVCTHLGCTPNWLE
ncbi:MAG: hypothetical protein JNG89_06440, partial [Planctomycetaceae bacterium]|nr:hypothetical protein [Planctomycetaceae bacterium]